MAQHRCQNSSSQLFISHWPCSQNCHYTCTCVIIIICSHFRLLPACHFSVRMALPPFPKQSFLMLQACLFLPPWLPLQFSNIAAHQSHYQHLIHAFSPIHDLFPSININVSRFQTKLVWHIWIHMHLHLFIYLSTHSFIERYGVNSF